MTYLPFEKAQYLSLAILGIQSLHDFNSVFIILVWLMSYFN